MPILTSKSNDSEVFNMYNDDAMTYSTTSHRYSLSADFVLTDMNINLDEALNTSGFVGDKANETEKILNRVSLLTYQHIYSYSAFPKKTERMLALENDYRETIKLAMAEQLEWMLNNGDISQYSGVNIEAGTAMDKRVLKGASFSPLAHDILVNGDIIKSAYYIGQKDITPDYSGESY